MAPLGMLTNGTVLVRGDEHSPQGMWERKLVKG